MNIEDKAVAMTIVDKELVNLFKSMYRVDGGSGYSGTKFVTHLDGGPKITEILTVPGYRI